MQRRRANFDPHSLWVAERLQRCDSSTHNTLTVAAVHFPGTPGPPNLDVILSP